MCFTYRILKPFDLNINQSMLSPALEKATFKAEVEFPLVYCLRATPSVTVDTWEDSSDGDSSDDEFFDALSNVDLERPTMEDFEDVSPANEDWTQVDWAKDDWIQDFWEQEGADNDVYTAANTDTQASSYTDEDTTKSDWTEHSFIDKQDRMDVWVRHTEYSLAQCNWLVFPADSDWPKPEADSSWGAPDLRLTTPEGEVCWLDDPTDYKSLPWEKQVAEERSRMLGAIW
ncbi:hypothetical protein QBC32DRAFT_376920 [Pseudoneurospora amorphoporcata]|uniref:Uncharacterized protein n=1 Tax=Pseudoneurospora amorphoporcata TaxID=241081 RepID=A0AAN6SEL9_9PEZI|nr:hypothetical protein QBC32DRAFT_376920 [Pseudoneurospora amorphoporcata]